MLKYSNLIAGYYIHIPVHTNIVLLQKRFKLNKLVYNLMYDKILI